MSPLDPSVQRLVLLLSGLATVALGLPSPQAEPDLAGQQVQLLTTAVGLALLLSAFAGVLRPPALGAALLVKLTYIAAWWTVGAGEVGVALAESALVLVLAGLAVAIACESRREARWNGGQSLQMET